MRPVEGLGAVLHEIQQMTAIDHDGPFVARGGRMQRQIGREDRRAEKREMQQRLV